ncbi:integral membrane protein [Nocardiopsis flavescens]|uniref:Integral membrane protein n=1 Tax=Nocardiopsis flavescens TaxID=758803 RepID=A0A1M6J7B1_9ACTN|nr:DUF3817 domain-containing protein [Nocardiopsis flavescens]SHJ42594.1 integral membrane protein [Nocardiopsis flavescens]
MNIRALNALAFRVIAVVEALTWVGLLSGMYVKYLGSGNEIGVQVFGMLHGIAFMAYVAACLVTAVHLRWGVWPTLLALAASVPPLFTLVADWWLHRSGRLPRLRAERVPETVG